jgi:putative RecB family exonuclease
MPVYSYSRIGCFENCPRKYKFQYIEKPPIEIAEGIEAFLGTVVHTVLEACYKLVSFGRPPNEEELLSLYQRTWTETYPAEVKIVREGVTADDYFRLGQTALRKYSTRHHPFDQETTLGLERNVSFALDPDEKYTMTGFIDRIGRDGSGRLRIHDYKTSATLPTQPEADADAQLALYQLAVETMWPNSNGIELVWHYLQFDVELISHRTPEQLTRLRQEYIGKIRRIEAATELENFPTQESALCNWCEYVALCPAKGGPGVIAPTPETPPMLNARELAAVVDEYLVLDGRKKEAEKRQQELREIISGHSETGTTTFLAGSRGGGVIVTINQAVKLPTRSADFRTYERVREMIQSAGLYHPFSALDMGKIQDALEIGSLPPDLAARLRPLAHIVPQVVIRIRKPR